MYMFVFKGVPAPTNPASVELKQALIHIWVMDPDASIAEERAMRYITDHGWNPTSVEYAFEILPETIPQVGAAESQLYQRACLYGIAADFLASPLAEGAPNDPVHIRRMK